MKKFYILLLILFSVYLNCSSNAQTLSDSLRQRAIDSLSSHDSMGEVLSSLFIIKDHDVREATPKLISTFFVHDMDIKIEYLKLLTHFGDSSAKSLAHLLIDSAGIYFTRHQDTESDSFYVKVECIKILYSWRDYSAAPCLFDYYWHTTPRPYFEVITELSYILDHDYSILDSAQAILRDAALHGDKSVRQTSLTTMQRSLMDDSVTYFDRAVNDSSADIRRMALENLSYGHYSGLNAFLIDRMSEDAHPLIRAEAAELLLRHFGNVSNYHQVLRHWRLETDTLAILDFFAIVNSFRPPRPDSSLSIGARLDTLVSLKHQVESYGWLGNYSFVVELDSILDISRNYISQGDSINCVRQMKVFQHRII
jgi:hypothetical protein